MAMPLLRAGALSCARLRMRTAILHAFAVPLLLAGAGSLTLARRPAAVEAGAAL